MALGYHTAQSFADFLGVSLQRLNNVENGFPLGLDLARRIRNRVPGVTLDWLLEGDGRGLSVDLADRLYRAQKGSGAAAS